MVMAFAACGGIRPTLQAPGERRRVSASSARALIAKERLKVVGTRVLKCWVNLFTKDLVNNPMIAPIILRGPLAL
jgi:hypothetical protein